MGTNLCPTPAGRGGEPAKAPDVSLRRIEPKNPVRVWHQLHPWQRSLALVSLSQAIVIVGFTFMNPLFPLFIQQDLGVEDPKKAAFWAGLTSATMAISMVVFGPFWGYLADRYGRKPMVVRAYLGGASVLLLTGLVTDVHQLIGLRMLHGAIAGSVGASMALAASMVPRNRIAMAVGMLQFSSFFAITMGPLMGGLIANAIGFRSTYFIASGIAVCAAIIVLFLVHEKFERPQETQGEGFTLFREMWGVLSTKGVMPALMVIAVVQGAPVILQPVIPGLIQLITSGDQAITRSGFAFATIGLASGVSAILIGKSSDRLDLRAVLIFSCFGAALAFLPQFFVHNYLVFLLLLAIFGIFSGGMLTSINAMVGQLIPKQHLGSAFGVVNSANAVAWGLSPLVGGSLALTIGLRRVFPAAAVMLALTGMAVVGVFKGIRSPAPGQLGTPHQRHP
ncbi:MAG: MFS transporter [Dehalococcoidia bacterium]